MATDPEASDQRMMKPERSVVEYSYMGDSGLRVSNICLGTSTFGDQSHEIGRPASDDAESVRILDKFVELGGNYIDTSDLYSLGGSERLIGKWLEGKCRDDFVINSKFSLPTNKNKPNCVGTSRKHMVQALAGSLERLKTDYVDTYLIHYFDRETPLEQTLHTLNDFVRNGKVHYIGVSNFTGWQLQKMVDIAKYMGLEKVVNVQTEYSLLARSAEYELIDVCKNEKIGLTPWCPLKGGWLAGKIRKGMTSPPEGSRIAWHTERLLAAKSFKKSVDCTSWGEYESNQLVWDTLGAVEDIAKVHGTSMAQISLRWLLQKEVVPSIVIGAKSVAQLVDNMGAASGWELSHDEMKRLNDVTAVSLPETYTNATNLDKYRI